MSKRIYYTKFWNREVKYIKENLQWISVLYNSLSSFFFILNISFNVFQSRWWMTQDFYPWCKGGFYIVQSQKKKKIEHEKIEHTFADRVARLELKKWYLTNALARSLPSGDISMSFTNVYMYLPYINIHLYMYIIHIHVYKIGWTKTWPMMLRLWVARVGCERLESFDENSFPYYFATSPMRHMNR